MSNNLGEQLARAAFDGDLASVRTCLDAGADVNGVYRGEPPLHHAIENQHLEVARVLIARGVDIDWDEKTMTPLMAALDSSIDGTLQTEDKLGNEPTDIVELLLQAGADVNVTVGGARPTSPLDLASDYGSEKFVRLLRRWGARTGAEIAGEESFSD